MQDRGAVECTGVSRRASVRCWRCKPPRGSHPPHRHERCRCAAVPRPNREKPRAAWAIELRARSTRVFTTADVKTLPRWAVPARGYRLRASCSNECWAIWSVGSGRSHPLQVPWRLVEKSRNDLVVQCRARRLGGSKHPTAFASPRDLHKEIPGQKRRRQAKPGTSTVLGQGKCSSGPRRSASACYAPRTVRHIHHGPVMTTIKQRPVAAIIAMTNPAVAVFQQPRHENANGNGSLGPGEPCSSRILRIVATALL